MKNWKKYLSLVLILVMCLSLVACGGEDNSDDDNDYRDVEYSVPESFEGMVKDSELMADYDIYRGIWTDENGRSLIVEMAETGDEVHFTLYDADNIITADGFIQTVPDYSADFFYNERDGVAHCCLANDGKIIQIDSFGLFTKASGDTPGENIGDTGYEGLAGEWYHNGDADAAIIIEISADGSWSYLERLGDDTIHTSMDWGKFQADENEEGKYLAVSDIADRFYEMTVAHDGVLYWDGEDNYFRKLS